MGRHRTTCILRPQDFRHISSTRSSQPATADQLFIFANLNGTISAWDKGPTAFIQVTTPAAVYTGLAINGPQTRLYAANGAGTGSVDAIA